MLRTIQTYTQAELRGRSIEWRTARKRDFGCNPIGNPLMDPGAQQGAVFFDAALKQGVTLFEPMGSLCSELEAYLLNGIHVNTLLAVFVRGPRRSPMVESWHVTAWGL